MTSSRPLDSITVVSLDHAIAAPFCTRQLADQGARVIKVERVGEGDFARHYDSRVAGQCSHFVWANRSKESLALDLKTPRAVQVMQRLLAQADVFVQNLAPGATARLGLDLEHFSMLSSVQLRERLDRAQIANAEVNTMADVWQHPQLAARRRWTEVDSPAGPIAALKPPGVNSAFTPRMDPVPALGEHNDAILRELGLGP